MKTTDDFISRLLTLIGSNGSRRAVAGLLVIVIAALTAYYTTVHGIRLTLNEKADRAIVADIDRRLITIETILRTDVAHRGDLSRMRDDFQRRLTRIETLLENKE